MRCYIHGNRNSKYACTNCGQFICEECNVEVDGKSVCKSCIQNKSKSDKSSTSSKVVEFHTKEPEVTNVEATKKKSLFILFLFSFIITPPMGLDYLYLGLKKRALFFLLFSAVLYIAPMLLFSIDSEQIFFTTVVIFFMFRFPIFFNVFRMRRKLAMGIHIEDSIQDIASIFKAYKVLIIAIVVSVLILFRDSLIIPIIFIPSAIVVGVGIVSALTLLLGMIFLFLTCFVMLKTNEVLEYEAIINPAPAKKESTTKEPENDLIKQGKIIAGQLNEKRDSLYYTNIGAQVEEIANTTNKILEFVDKYPEKARKLNKFIEYYMPTTVKLLSSYEHLNMQNLSGKNIDEASRKIEDMVQNLSHAFSKQHDALFEEKSLDIDSEIKVLSDILKREGLLED